MNLLDRFVVLTFQMLFMVGLVHVEGRWRDVLATCSEHRREGGMRILWARWNVSFYLPVYWPYCSLNTCVTWTCVHNLWYARQFSIPNVAKPFLHTKIFSKQDASRYCRKLCQRWQILVCFPRTAAGTWKYICPLMCPSTPRITYGLPYAAKDCGTIYDNESSRFLLEI